MNELVSIIMPSYNTANYIAHSIQSVLNQTYQKWELLIIDDCSTDNTYDVIKSFQDKRIKLFQNKKNCGAAISRNKGLKEANGKWIAFLDSDDIWFPEKLERQISFMKCNKYVFSYTNYEEINEESIRNGKIISGPKIITKNKMFRYCWPGCLTVMFDKEYFGIIQIEDIKKNNDYAVWLQLCKRANCYLLDEVLGQYREGRQGSISTNNIITKLKWHYKLFRIAEKEHMVMSLLHTIENVFWGLLKKIIYVKKEK